MAETACDEIAGRDGNDTLNGGRGNDIMQGDAGQDVFYVDSAGDFVVELAGEGFDNVYASVSYTLARRRRGRKVEDRRLLRNDCHRPDRQ